jgi:antagonist of KipI
VPVGGALDRVSHESANALVGNDVDAATLEVTLLGPEIRLETSAVIAVSGANLTPQVDGADVSLNTPVACRPGSVLRFGERRSGDARVPRVRWWYRRVARSRQPRDDATVCIGRSRRACARRRRSIAAWKHAEREAYKANRPPPIASGGARLRVLPGPQDDFFPEEAFDRMRRTRFTITSRSDRMGYRLEGAQIPRIAGREMISDATFVGGIQVPQSGEPIMLMSDRQTTGGYPQIATVITADLPAAGQLGPGDWVEFELCTRREALSALIAQEGKLLALR